jgi:tryptophan 2,3-dioxygenase
MSTTPPAGDGGSDQHPGAGQDELSYGGYLHLDELLAAQHPRTGEHDELLFVIIHQVYELWFKQILHELALLQRRLEAGDGVGAMQTARRVAKILKTAVGQMDVLETMTPHQFASFRPELGSSSGFQSFQFRWIEATLGRRDFPAGDATLDAILRRRGVFDSLLRYLDFAGWKLPGEILDRDPRLPWPGDEAVQAALAEAYAQDRAAAAALAAEVTAAPAGRATAAPADQVAAAPAGLAAPAAHPATASAAQVTVGVCEALVDIDEGLQEWRYRHVKMVERIIGARTGTGGSTGTAYLRSTLFHPSFPDLWQVRSRS